MDEGRELGEEQSELAADNSAAPAPAKRPKIATAKGRENAEASAGS